MKVAVFHNYLDNIGGAEHVALTLGRIFDCPVYTTNVNRQMVENMGYGDVAVESIGRVPINSPYRQFMTSRRFSKLDLRNKYDAYIISGDWALYGAVKHKPNIWYPHSPTREIWDLKEHVKREFVRPVFWPLFDVWAAYNRVMYRRLAPHATVIAANSLNVQDRITRFLHRDSVVVHPPTDTGKFKYARVGDYWLSVNRLIPHKRVELQLEAFRLVSTERLLVVGCFEKAKHWIETEKKLQGLIPKNVSFLSHITQEELRRHFGECRGFIATAIDEDFGMTPVEAMAAGKPVVAVNEGGYRETVLDGVTGRLVDAEPEKLAEAVREVSRDPGRYRRACEKRAKEFDISVFEGKIRRLLEEITT